MSGYLSKKKDDLLDPADRLRALVEKLAPRIRRKFVELIERIKGEKPLNELADMIAAGRVDEALALGEKAIRVFAAESATAFQVTGKETANFMNSKLKLTVVFDQSNDRAVRIMQGEKLRLIREFTNEQRDVVREALADGINRGLNPIEQARQFRSSIGLTRRQWSAVRNYRRLLEEQSPDALLRRLRDRRHDATLRAAIDGAKPLTKAQIDTMVKRYTERFIKYRAETIARTEALRAVHLANREMYHQAFESGDLDPSLITREWNTAKDERVRGSHAAMHGQQRGFDEAFLSGDGNKLRFPGDPEAPAEDVVNCRCSMGTRIRLPSLSVVS